MLTLNNHLTLNAEAIRSPNLCDRFDKEDLDAIGNWVFDGYTADKQSRFKWEKRTDSAMDLAMQLQKEKNFPWANCSNIAFPLVTISAMQFHARAYPTIIQGTDIVKMRVVGPDPDDTLHTQAHRISTHMSYQVLEEDQGWEEQHDRLLLILGITGSCFVKTFYDPAKRHNVSELVLPRDLVINYWATSVEECPRKTHRIPLSRNEIREGVLSDTYRDVLDEEWYQQPILPQLTSEQIKSDRRIGQQQAMQPDETTPYYGLEQHCNLDLDDDGYAEPYIILVEENSKCVLRIVSRVGQEADITRVQRGKYKGDIVSVRAEESFTKYSFIPSPDGGIYDVGFGVLLGPLNESVNSIINQLVDAGTMANTAGGFLGRGAKIRGGVYTFQPFGWQRVDSMGEDLHKSIFPLPVREPSAVLFQLLGMLVNYTNRISGSTDAMVGENPGQNTPAQTQQSMIEMGSKIYNAIFKRVWRGMKEEFRKLYLLNATYLPILSRQFGNGQDSISQEDYKGDPNKVVPVADPNITSEQQEIQQAMMLKQLSQGPGFNQDFVNRKVLKAMRIDDLDKVYPGMGSKDATPPPVDPKLQIAQMKTQVDQGRLQLDQQQHMMDLIEERKLTVAKIVELEAKAAMELAQADGVQAGHELARFDAIIGLLKLHKEHLDTRVSTMLDHHNQALDRQHEFRLEQLKANASSDSGGVGSVAPPPSNPSSAPMGAFAA